MLLLSLKPLVISTEEKNEKECYQSEKELTKIKEFLKGLPRSPPVSILSDEKWYPYSQYVFHSDGTLFTDSVERVAAPTVPDVLSIDLPTGFDFSKPSKQKSSTPPQQKAIPIDGGLPPTPEVAQARHVDKVEVDAEQSAKNDDGFGER